jgi:ribosomal protein S18 acetylase RimI-like enzyme
MQFRDRPEFERTERQEIYDLVERRGRVDYEAARKELGMDHEMFGHHAAMLVRDGALDRTEEDMLEVAFESGADEEYTVDGMTFTIRQARQEDLTGLIGAIRETTETAPYVEAESVADIVESEEALLRHNDIASRVFFVATVSEDVVGWVHVEGNELDKLSHTAELTVGVVDQYRGLGIGSHLLVRGVGWAAANGYERVYNSVPATNGTAAEFLQDHGWELEATRKGHYRIDGDYVDELMLAVQV